MNSFFKEFKNDFLFTKRIIHMANERIAWLIIPVILSTIASFFESFGIVLIIPALKGLIEKNFNFINKTPYYQHIKDIVPPFIFKNNTTIFISLVCLIFLSVFMKNITQYIASLMAAKRMLKITCGVKTFIFRRFLSFGKMYFNKISTSYIIMVLDVFVQKISQFFRGVFMESINQATLLVILVAIMIRISWEMTIFVVVLFITLHFSSRWIINKIRKTSKYVVETKRALARYRLNILTNIPLVKSYKSEEDEILRYRNLVRNNNAWSFSQIKKSLAIPAIQDILSNFFILTITAGVAYLVIRQKTTDIASFIVFFYILKKSTVSSTFVAKIFKSHAQISNHIAKVREVLSDKDKFFIKDGNKPLKQFIDKIEFKNLNFQYSKDRKILSDISFTVKKGEVVAIVGPTGAGKTTIANLFLRFYDCSPGTIIVDGEDIRNYKLATLLSHVGYVSQETLLFDGSIRDNLAYGIKGKVSDEDLARITKQAQIYDFIFQQKDRYDAKIGERGVRLSGGEKQRLTIARALLRNPDILVLDEATSSLDSTTEHKVQEAINAAVKGKTAIVIAHRLSTIKEADRVVVLDKGKITETGSIEELLKKKGKFYELWKQQKFD